MLKMLFGYRMQPINIQFSFALISICEKLEYHFTDETLNFIYESMEKMYSWNKNN